MTDIERVPVVRQRYCIEATCKNLPDRIEMLFFMKKLSNAINMKIIGEPNFLEVSLPHDQGTGLHLAVNWVYSGAVIYSWLKYNFITLDVYTCLKFEESIVDEVFLNSFEVINANSYRPAIVKALK